MNFGCLRTVLSNAVAGHEVSGWMGDKVEAWVADIFGSSKRN